MARTPCWCRSGSVPQSEPSSLAESISRSAVASFAPPLTPHLVPPPPPWRTRRQLSRCFTQRTPCLPFTQVNLDRDPKERPTGINLPPVQLNFVRNPATDTSLQLLQRGGKQVMNANAVIKAMKGDAPAAAPAGAPAAATPAPASAAPAAAAAVDKFKRNSQGRAK